MHIQCPNAYPVSSFLFSDDGLSMNEIDLKLTNYNVIASRLGLTERRPIPDPMPFPYADPLGATTLASTISEPSDSTSGMFYIPVYLE